MANAAKPWPYLAADARDRAAEAVVSGIRILEPLHEVIKEADQLRRISKATIELYRIARILEGAGAKTRA